MLPTGAVTTPRCRAKERTMDKEPFTIAVPEAVLTDLRERLTRTRWPEDFANPQWEYGTPTAYLKELVNYWIHRYDWRQHEQAMNAFPHYKVTIDGMPIHFLHQPGKGPKPIPLLLNHGWPDSFWMFQKVIRPLADPAESGGDPADAFDVVIPSLPGFGFSTPLTKPGMTGWSTADVWATLMTDVLGYKKFGTQGGDWGGVIVSQLGHKYAVSDHRGSSGSPLHHHEAWGCRLGACMRCYADWRHTPWPLGS